MEMVEAACHQELSFPHVVAYTRVCKANVLYAARDAA